jgi:hypothetical protein
MTTYSIFCASCERFVAADIVCGLDARVTNEDALYLSGENTYWLRCPVCSEGSVKTKDGRVSPTASPARHIQGIPTDVSDAWKEAGLSYAAGAYTASEMLCRKILMHVAVERTDSKAGKNFTEYVDDLENAGLLTAGLKPVVDLVRQRGNTANHDLASSTQDEAVQTMKITEHLLRGIYELPGLGNPSH